MFNVDAVAKLGRSAKQVVCVPEHLIVDFLTACQAAGHRWHSGTDVLDSSRIKQLQTYAPVNIYIYPGGYMSWNAHTDGAEDCLTSLESLMVSDFPTDIHSFCNDLICLLKGEESLV